MPSTRSNKPELKGLEALKAAQKARDSYPLPKRVGELYDEEGRLKSAYLEHRPAERAVTRYHKRVAMELNGDGNLSEGLKQAIKLAVIHQQIVYRYPWAVVWVRLDKKGRRVRGYKKFTSLAAAYEFQQKAVRKVPTATVVSRTRSYHIPPALRGRIPKPFYWCPRCMKPRKYVREDSDRTFWALKKRWSDSKGRYEWVERKLAYLVCPLCRCNNRDPVWRASNQPWEVRRIKAGVRRVKRRRQVKT